MNWLRMVAKRKFYVDKEGNKFTTVLSIWTNSVYFQYGEKVKRGDFGYSNYDEHYDKRLVRL